MAYLPCVLLLALMLAQPVLRASSLWNTLSKEHTSAPTALNNVLFDHSGFRFLDSIFSLKAVLIINNSEILLDICFFFRILYVPLNGILCCLYA